MSDTVILCLQVGGPTDEIVAGSRQVPCARCAAPLWVSPFSQRKLMEGGCIAVCLACVRPSVGGIDVEPIHPEQLIELFHDPRTSRN